MKKQISTFLTAAVIGYSTLVSGPGFAGAMNVVESVAESPVTNVTVFPGTPLMDTVPHREISTPRVSEQEALAILRSTFPDLNTNGEKRVDLDNDFYRSKTLWRIDGFESTTRLGPYRFGPPTGFRAAVDAETGDILEMYRYGFGPTDEIKGIISQDEGRQIAEKLARQLQPEEFAQVRFNDKLPDYLYQTGNPLQLNYTFSWDRVHNGVIVDNDGFRVTINGLTGQVTNYYFNWRQDLKLPTNETSLAVETLMKQILENAGMVLVYHAPYLNTPTGAVLEVKLVYQLNSRYGAMVDAITGEHLDYQGRVVAWEELKLYENYTHIAGDGNPPISSTQRISTVEAQATAEAFFVLLGIEGRIERSGGGSSSGPLGRQEYWSFSIYDSKSGFAGSVGVDTATGQIVNYYRPDFSYFVQPPMASTVMQVERETSLTREETLSRAKEFLEKVAPEYTGQLVVEKYNPAWYMGSEQMHNFRFTRVVNGVPFPMDGINIAVSPDGQIINFNLQWSRVNFPQVESLISPEEAAKAWLENTTYTLAYYFPRSFDGRMMTDEAKLIHRLDPGAPQMIDAVTGQPLDYSGRPITEGKRNDYDFSDSWVEPALELLAQSGLLPPPDEFQPSASVTRRDAVRVLTAAMIRYYGSYNSDLKPSFQDVQTDDPDLGVIEVAVMLEIVDRGDRFHPNQALTRKELAAWLVNAIGFRDVTAIPNRITSPFEDLDSLSGSEVNAIGLAYGLGFMVGDGSDSFRPTDELTWEELAAAILKTLPQLTKNAMW